MKKTIIGASLMLTGSIMTLPIILFCGNNLVSGWSSPPGRFMTTVTEYGMQLPLAFTLLLIAAGLAALAIEYFRKEK